MRNATTVRNRIACVLATVSLLGGAAATIEVVVAAPPAHADAPACPGEPGCLSTVAGGGTLDPSLADATGAARFGNTLYLADWAGYVFARDLTTGEQSLYAGTPGTNGFSGDGGPATSALFAHPWRVAVDAEGNLYVGEDEDGSTGCRIRKIDHASHVITTVAGTGTCGETGDGGAATSAEIADPSGMAVGPDDNLYFTTGGSNIRRVDHDGIIDTVIGSASVGGYQDGPVGSAAFSGIAQLAFDATGNMYIVENSSNDAIRKIAWNGSTFTTVTTIAGGGATGGVEDANGPNLVPIGPGYFGSTSGVAISEARFDHPSAIAVADNGDLVIDDQDNHYLRRIVWDGDSFDAVTTISGTGTDGDAGDEGPATAAETRRVRQFEFDASGGLYVVEDNHGQPNHLRYIDTASPAVVHDRTLVTGAPGDGGPATDAPIAGPVDLVRVPGTSDLYVAEQQGFRIRKITGETGIITTFAGTGAQGSTGDGGPATEAGLAAPTAVAYDPTGTGAILIAGSDAKIRRVDLHTNVITTVAGDGNTCADPTAVSHPCGDGGPATDAQLGNEIGGIVVKADATVVVADTINRRIRQIDPSTNVITTIAGTGVEPAGTSSDDDTPALSAELLAPSRVVIEPSTGDLVFSDVCDRAETLVPILQGHWADIKSHCDGRVRKLVADEHGDLVLTTIAGRAGKLCEPDITSLIGVLVATYSFTPDPSLFAYDPTPNCGDGGPATSASIRGPVALRFDAAGNLYIGEIGGSFLDLFLNANGTPGAPTVYPDIRRVDAAAPHNISTFAGQDGGFSGDGGMATDGKFFFPVAIAPDQGTHLFVADYFPGRIRRIEGPKPDLRVSLSAEGPLTAGRSGVVHVTVQNAATDPDAYLTGPVSTDVTLPAGLSYASSSVTSSVASWSCDGAGQSVSCATPDNVAPQASSTFDVTVNVAADAEGVVTVNATGTSDSDVIDPDHQVAVLGISIRRAASGGSDGGYVLVGADGGTFAFGSASFPGALAVPGNRAVAAAPAGGPGSAHGAWLASGDGSVFTTGDAQFFGSLASTRLNSPIVGIAAHGTDGYWLVAADGGVFAQGSAGFHGSLGAMPLNSPIVGMTPTPSGDGYWLVAADGGVFAFGDAEFAGSHGATPLNSPVVAMRATQSGHGYWLAAADGGVFAYGDAVFSGSPAGTTLNTPIVAIVASTQGTGYQLVAADGGVFAYGTATYDGSMATSTLNAPIIAAW